MKYFKILSSLPSQLVLILLFSFTMGEFVPLEWKQFAYSISLTIKEGLIFVLPAIIFAYIFSTISTIQRKNALFLVLVTLSSLCLSNFISTWIAYGVGKLASSNESIIAGLKITQQGHLSPAFQIHLPSWLPNENALVLGFIFGMIVQVKPLPQLLTFSQTLKKAADIFLNRIFIPLVPLFVLGFALKLQFEGTLDLIVKNYGPLFFLFVSIEILYIFLLYSIASGFNPKKTFEMIRNAVPSMISGFSTMSSAGSMPLTLKAAEENTGRPELVRAIIPMTANNHLIGDTLFISLMAVIFTQSSQGDIPSLTAYLQYSFYFVLAMFAVAAVPGGGIIVMIPILEKYLGLNSEILSLMTTLYILFDPFNTVANIAGNGAFAVILANIISARKEKEPAIVALGGIA